LEGTSAQSVQSQNLWPLKTCPTESVLQIANVLNNLQVAHEFLHAEFQVRTRHGRSGISVSTIVDGGNYCIFRLASACSRMWWDFGVYAFVLFGLHYE
jgi:hypothetical protein